MLQLKKKRKRKKRGNLNGQYFRLITLIWIYFSGNYLHSKIFNTVLYIKN